MEQRDYAIMYGSSGCTTLVFKNNRFVFPGEDRDCLNKDKKTKQTLLEKLSPSEGDIIIISSSDDSFLFFFLGTIAFWAGDFPFVAFLGFSSSEL